MRGHGAREFAHCGVMQRIGNNGDDYGRSFKFGNMGGNVFRKS